MSPEFIAIIAVGVILVGVKFILHIRMERRFDRLDKAIDRHIRRLEEAIDRSYCRGRVSKRCTASR